MNLFIIEGTTVKPTQETLLIYPFSEIWNRDTSENKEWAQKDFTYIEFLCSPKEENPFYGYDKESGIRSQKIIENIQRTIPNYDIDDIVKEGVDIYEEFLHNASPSLSYYESNLAAANKVKNFFLTFDMNERNEKTNVPIFTAKGITDAIKNADDVLIKLDSMKKKVQQEVFQNVKTTGNRGVNHFER